MGGGSGRGPRPPFPLPLRLPLPLPLPFPLRRRRRRPERGRGARASDQRPHGGGEAGARSPPAGCAARDASGKSPSQPLCAGNWTRGETILFLCRHSEWVSWSELPFSPPLPNSAFGSHLFSPNPILNLALTTCQLHHPHAAPRPCRSLIWRARLWLFPTWVHPRSERLDRALDSNTHLLLKPESPGTLDRVLLEFSSAIWLPCNPV